MPAILYVLDDLLLYIHLGNNTNIPYIYIFIIFELGRDYYYVFWKFPYNIILILI